MVFPPSPGPSRVVEQRPRRLGIARGQIVAPESIDGANPLIADLFERGSCGCGWIPSAVS